LSKLYSQLLIKWLIFSELIVSFIFICIHWHFILDVTVFLSLTVFQKIILETLPEVSTALPVIGTSCSNCVLSNDYLLSFSVPFMALYIPPLSEEKLMQGKVETLCLHDFLAFFKSLCLIIYHLSTSGNKNICNTHLVLWHKENSFLTHKVQRLFY
jgi:hypothetical protein